MVLRTESAKRESAILKGPSIKNRDCFSAGAERFPMTVLDATKPIGIAPHFSVHVVNDREVLLLSEQRSYRLGGKLYVALLPFLDGKRTGEEIVTAFAGRIAPDRLRGVLSS